MGQFSGVWGAWKGYFFSGLSGPLCKWEMRIGVFSKVKGDWKWFFFSVGCLVHCVGGRWGLGRCRGAWKGIFF